MAPKDASPKLSKFTTGTVCALSGAIAFALLVLIGIIVPHINFSDPKDTGAFGILLSVVTPFALFFGVIACRALQSLVRPQEELMSIKGWRILAGSLLVLGIVGAFLMGWVAFLVPCGIALFCLWKENKLMEKLKELGLIW